MIYLDQFKLPLHEQEDKVIRQQISLNNLGYTENSYPCNLFIQKALSSIDFSDVTILYGGNGSGKSTLLNLITHKLQLKRSAPFNSSNVFDYYTEFCTYKMGYDDDGDKYRIPNGSRIITSDDVFDYMLSVREHNKRLSSNVENLLEEQEDYCRVPMMKLKGIENYEEFSRQLFAKRNSARKYVFSLNGKEVKLNSNGETAMLFFYNKLKNDTLFLLDEPENSLSPKFQIELAEMIKDMAKYSGCQFIIATHSPFMLSIEDAKIYDLDEYPVAIKKWWELENPKVYFEFFYKHKQYFDK